MWAMCGGENSSPVCVWGMALCTMCHIIDLISTVWFVFVNGGNWSFIPETDGYWQLIPQPDVNQVYTRHSKMPEEEKPYIYNSEASSIK